VAWFKTKDKSPLVKASQGRRKTVEIPVGLYAKCKGCSEIIYNQDLDKNLRVCPKCGFHYPLSATERLYLTVDAGTFEEHDEGLVSLNPLSFPGYEEKLAKGRARTQCADAVLSGLARIGGVPVSIAITDFQFMGGSMGSVVGEKISRAAERAQKRRCALVVVSSSGGGARMQEGMFSLMQMAKTSAALARLHQARLPYLSVLTDPTAGGVAASFGMLGDLNIAEPGAMIGFAGPRVIEQTIRQKLPAGFQRSEFVLQKGFVDLIVPRPQLRDTLAKVLKFFKG
jgi:acetyl-CoA carboxylase carboxyl transferase subunit beta